MTKLKANPRHSLQRCHKVSTLFASMLSNTSEFSSSDNLPGQLTTWNQNRLPWVWHIFLSFFSFLSFILFSKKLLILKFVIGERRKRGKDVSNGPSFFWCYFTWSVFKFQGNITLSSGIYRHYACMWHTDTRGNPPTKRVCVCLTHTHKMCVCLCGGGHVCMSVSVLCVCVSFIYKWP